MSTSAVSPGSSSMRRDVDPPASPSGMRRARAVADAEASCADCAPTRTCGATGSIGNPSPSSVTRPPSIPHSGRTDVTRPNGTLAFVGELDVPVEVIAPRFGSVSQPDGDPDGWGFVRTSRHADEMHAGLLRGAAALAAVAGDAAGNDVLPIFSATLGDRHDMIEGEIGAGERLGAVLTRVLVARVDVRAGEGDVVDLSLDLDVTEQPDDRRELEAERDRPDLAVVHGDDFDLPLAPQRDGLLPVDDLQRLVRRVEKERLLHSPETFCLMGLGVSKGWRASGVRPIIGLPR